VQFDNNLLKNRHYENREPLKNILKAESLFLALIMQECGVLRLLLTLSKKEYVNIALEGWS
jgi:hypothetical protein